jgi:hypothetical protein
MANKYLYKLKRLTKALIAAPVMTQREIRFIESLLEQSDIVLEWGAGGSTLRFAKQVQHYYSVEHSKSWYEKIKRKSPNNVTLLYIPATGDYPDYPAYNTLGDGRPEDFQDYIYCINRIPETPTVFLIDGRVRIECLKMIKSILTPQGKVFLHDFDRYKDNPELNNFQIQNVVDQLALLQIKA